MSRTDRQSAVVVVESHRRRLTDRGTPLVLTQEERRWLTALVSAEQERLARAAAVSYAVVCKLNGKAVAS